MQGESGKDAGGITVIRVVTFVGLCGGDEERRESERQSSHVCELA